MECAPWKYCDGCDSDGEESGASMAGRGAREAEGWRVWPSLSAGRGGVPAVVDRENRHSSRAGPMDVDVMEGSGGENEVRPPG